LCIITINLCNFKCQIVYIYKSLHEYNGWGGDEIWAVDSQESHLIFATRC